MRRLALTCAAGLVDAMSYPELGHVFTSAVATVLTIWALLLAARFPNWDWYGLPVLGTAYPAVGAWLEATPVPAYGLRKRISPM